MKPTNNERRTMKSIPLSEWDAAMQYADSHHGDIGMESGDERCPRCGCHLNGPFDATEIAHYVWDTLTAQNRVLAAQLRAGKESQS